MSAVFFVGGTRSGKSALAQAWAEAQAAQRLFVATCQVEDAEMGERVARHQAARGEGWQCQEEALDPLSVLRTFWAGEYGAGVALLDCVSLWVANLLAQHQGSAGVMDAIGALAQALRANRAGLPVALVSSETGQGIVPLSPLGRLYRDTLGMANQMLASACDQVVLVICGLPLALKGPLPQVFDPPWAKRLI